MADAGEKYLSYFPDDFKKYMCKGLIWLPLYFFPLSIDLCGGVFWSREDDKPQRPSTLPDGEGRSFLTARNQPFSLLTPYNSRLVIDGLCGYRMICMDSKFDIDLDGGKTCEQHLPLPGRVFKDQLPESTPDVEFYSITEYPQRDDALRCGVQ
ncbi:hypothetical protein CsSME_00018238 [Camellia sinensis var. sinensis]